MSFCLLLIAVCCSTKLQSQRLSPYFEHITVDHRLSSNYVTSIYQDRKGFLWFGTDDGLNRYDGNQITVFRNSANDTNSLKNNYIDAILEDNQGNLLIGTSKGIQVYNWYLNGFIDFQFSDLPVALRTGNVESAVFDGQSIWIAIENTGLYEINQELDDIKLFQYDSSSDHGLSSNTIEKLYVDRSKRVWVVADNQLHVIKNRSIQKVSSSDLQKELITTILQDSKGNYWLGTERRGLLKVSVTEDLKELVILDRYEVDQISPILYVEEDRRGNVLAAFGGQGLAIIPDGDLSNASLYKSSKAPNSLNFPSILTIYEDQVGDIWLGTVGGGVNVIHQNKQAFDHFINLPTNKNSIGANDINQFETDQDGNIWIGTKTGGVSKFEPEQSRFTNYNAQNSFLKSNSVIAIEVDKDGDLWLGGWDSGLIRTDKNFRVKQVYNTSNSNLLSNHIFDLKLDKSNNLWIGTLHGGLAKLSKQNNEITNYLADGTIPDKSPIALETHKQNLLFFGGYSGLGLLNIETDQVKYYTFKEDLSSISSDKIQCFFVENDSIIWIGTSDGLNKFNLKTEKFSHYFIEDGLPSNSVKGITKDDEGFLWLSTNYGISKFAHLLDEFKNFTKSDGLQGNQFNSASILKLDNNKIIAGGVNGFNMFDPDSVEINKRPPNLILTGFKVDEKSMNWFESEHEQLHVSETSEVRIKHNTSFFSVSYVGLNYNSSKLNQYKYRLRGYDDNWYSTESLVATFQGIPPGEYVFEVIASNNHGVWNSTGASLNIIVLTPWWNTFLFKILLISFIAFLAYIIIKARTNSLKRYHQKLKTLVKERTKELQTTTDQLQEKQEEVLDQNHKLEQQKQELQNALSNLKKMQTQYVQSEKMASIGVLVAGIAHEINNPLQLINGGRDLINRDIKQEITEDKAKHFKSSLDMIEQGVNRAAAIVDSLNSFNNYSSKEEKVCYVNEIIDNCLLVLKPELSRNIEVTKDLSSSVPEMIGSPGDLHQIFINILKNSIDSIKKQGAIQIISSIENDFIKVTFQDNGEGIEASDLARVMDPFFTTKEPGHGIGMGMAIAYQIIQKYNGDILYSSEKGMGTIVSVLIKVSS